MLFNTLQYLLFLPAVVAIYYVAPRRFHLWILLIASYWFYASWNPVYLILIAGMTVVNHLLGLGLGRLGRSRSGKWLLGVAVVFNVAALSLFKYAHFILTNLVAVLGRPNSPLPDNFSLVLPLGISFFAFEFIHYQVDVWRGNRPVKSLLHFAVFAAFFPTQVAGPIKRYENFEPQLAERAAFDWGRTWEGLHLVVVGLFKKVVLADNLAPLTLLGFQQLQPGRAVLSPLDAWLVVLAFGTQLYFDFSGYTDIGRGSALLLGYTVPKNFIRPLIATTILRFWGRWHLSLTSWLTDYIYTPLGGKRYRYSNLMLTMVVGGLWHGANWTFVAWGFFNGVILGAYWFLKIKQWMPTFQDPRLKFGWMLIGWFFTHFLIYLSLVFFRSANMTEAFTMFGSLFGLRGSAIDLLLPMDRFLIVAIFGGRLASDLFFEHQRWLKKHLPASIGRLQARWGFQWVEAQPVGYAVLIAVIILFRPVELPRFIYFQF